MQFIFIAMFLASIPSIACPVLSGSYSTCHSTTGQETDFSQVVVEQNTINQISHYKIHSVDSTTEDRATENYEADGKPKVTIFNDQDNGTVIRTETLASCNGNFLNVKLNVSIDAATVANIKVKVSKVANQLIQVYTGENMGEPVNDTIICE